MRDIPFFTTENGVASLTLSEIPYKSCAYVRVQSASDPHVLLSECADFCTAAGAKCIYATGHEALEHLPIFTEIWEMSRLRDGIGDTDAALFPVTENTAEQWRGIYNSAMLDVPNSATMTVEKMREQLEMGNGYFVHREGLLLGIGIAGGDRVDTVISVLPGSGQDVLLALNHALSEEKIMVQVASRNLRAVNLYRRLGFIKAQVISRWFKIS